MEGNGDKVHKRTFWLTFLAAAPGAVLAAITIMGLLWRVFLASAVVAAVTDSVADDLKNTVDQAIEQHLAPVNAGLKASIQSAIAEYEDDIATLQYRKERDPGWTLDDEQQLTRKLRRLAAQRMALAAILAAESNQ